MEEIKAPAPASRFEPGEVERLLAEHEKSGLSLAAFARSKGLAPHRLYDARRRARRRSTSDRAAATAAFEEVRVVDRESETSPVELILPSGLSIRIRRGFDDVALRRLLGVLSSC